MDASSSIPVPAPGRAPALRASDTDRERVAAALRRHHLDGRLDTDELQERLGACYAARTHGELDVLLADLPGEARPMPRRPDGAPPAPRLAWPAAPVVAVLLVAVLLATAGAFTHGHPGPLPLLLVFLLFRLGRGPRRPWTAGSARG
jgi:Domain of unknown function (DUF1707)